MESLLTRSVDNVVMFSYRKLQSFKVMVLIDMSAYEDE